MATPSTALPAPIPQHPSSPTTDGLSWEGDRMFNIYIHDYCHKRGFRKTARELQLEAEISPDEEPPINAKQGLLFEWWSVFWVLFTAKSNGTGSDDAIVYTQHVTQQQIARHQQQTRMQQQTQGPRFPNGVARTPGMPNGPMPNGVMPPRMTGPPGTLPMGGPAPPNAMGRPPHSNGIIGVPPTAAAPNAPGVPGQQPNHWAPPPGQVPPPGTQRPQYSSPTMNPAVPPGIGVGPPNPGQHQHPPPHMVPPSPHLTNMARNVGGFPPNGMMGGPNMNNNAAPPPMPGPSQPPNQGFQLPRSSSRPNTPGMGALPHRSPSMAHRQIGGPQPQASDDMRRVLDSQVSADLSRIPATSLIQAKQEAGLAEKDLQMCTLEEKQLVVQAHRRQMTSLHQRGLVKTAGQGPGPAGPSTLNAPPGPSQTPQGAQRGGPRVGAKRQGSSPHDDQTAGSPPGEGSPQAKRPRRSPSAMEPNLLGMPGMPPHGGPPPPPGQPNGMGRPLGVNQPMPNGGFIPPGGRGMPNTQINPAMNMSHMNPMLMPPASNQHMLTQQLHQQQQQQQQQQYRQNMAAMHAKIPFPTAMMQHGPHAASPPSDPSLSNDPAQLGGPRHSQTFPGGPPSLGGPSGSLAGPPGMVGRPIPPPGPGQMKPPPPTMMPPASPSAGGGKPPGSGPSLSQPSVLPKDGVMDGSAGPSRPESGLDNTTFPNPSSAAPSARGPSPATPAPGPAPSPSQGLQGPPQMNSMPSIPPPAPSTQNNTAALTQPLFPTEFMGFEDFDPNMFRTDGAADINFEQDFTQWFNPDATAELNLS